jgi:hypothetical protein
MAMNWSPRLKVLFDSDADVLYISRGEPVSSHVDELENGILLRRANSDGSTSGITALDFREHWHFRKSDFYSLVADHLRVPTSVAEREIERLI